MSDPKQAARPDQPLVFLIRADLRRSAVYFLVGMVLIAAIRWALDDLFPPVGPGSWRTILPCSLFGLVPLAVLSWRLQIDSAGISRRRLWLRDVCPWEFFEQGKVKDVEGESTSYVVPEKPFWARKLSLDVLEDSDRARVESIIDRLRVRSAFDLPVELAVRYGFRKEAIFAPGGLLLRAGDDETRYSWKEVQTVRIRRFDRRRRDFKSLEVVLPDRVVKFSVESSHGQPNRSWSGTGGLAAPTSEVLAAFLERSVPGDRIQVTSLGEVPLTVAEREDRRSVLAGKRRELKFVRRFVWAGGGLILLVALWEFRQRMISAGLLSMISSALLMSLSEAILRDIESDSRKTAADLETQIPEP